MCADCLAERESKLRAERELNEAALATSERLATLAESLATAERERDEARFQLGLMSGPSSEHAAALAAAQKRIEGLEAALRAGVKARGRMHTTCGGEGPRACPVCVALRLADAALSSPAVTAGGKKLGEEGGGT